jgi:hypothetical protein
LRTGSRGGPLLAGAARALLFACTFLTWFSLTSVSFDIGQANGLSDANLQGLPTTEFRFTQDDLDIMAGAEGRSRNAWESLGAVKVVVVLAALGSVALLVSTLAGIDPPRVALSAVALLGALAALLLLYRVINPPDLISADGGGLIPAGADPSIGVERGLGVWLALLAAIGVAAGGFLALSEAGGNSRRRVPDSRIGR